jgi:hypothetical protein
LSRAVNTYSDNVRASISRSPGSRNSKRSRKKNGISNFTESRKWVPFAAAGFLTVMICVTVNFRAFTEYRKESGENETLNNQVQTLTTENIALQEESHSWKSDPQTLEREAKKFGYERPKEKIPVPTK